MKQLAIETSCDETSLALLDGATLVTHLVSSQINDHKAYGGVVPEIASRKHTETIHSLLRTLFKNANWQWSDLTHISVTQGPGLEGALLVGISVAKTMATILSIPIIPVNHLHGHIYSIFLDYPQTSFPFIALLVSGGHSMIIHATDHFKFTVLGSTRDDAIGEAFDKVARLLGLPYPGGPAIDALAKEGNPSAFQFPQALKNKGLDLSFSGLKSAVWRTVNECSGSIPVADIAASFQKAACDSLISKTKQACQLTDTDSVIICGGVSANSYLRKHLAALAPSMEFCTDNAAMIGQAAYYMVQQNIPFSQSFNVNSSASL